MKRNFKLGAWLQLGSVHVFKIMANYNFDFYVIDLEHGSHDGIELFPLLKRTDSKLYVRVSTRSIDKYKWFFDIGYDGIILSDVKSHEDVDALVRSSYFPPIGNRGVGYCARNGFGKDISNYLENNSNPFLAIQIESVQGVNCLENILNLYHEKISACFLGPFDLSCDLGITGDFLNPIFQNQKQKYLEILKKFNNTGKGIHVVSNDFNEVLDSSSNGYNFIAYSTDGLLLQNSLNQINNI